MSTSSKPGGSTYTTGGFGSSSHLAVAFFSFISGANFNHVPYKGAGPVEGDRCSFTNCSWTIDGRETRDRFEFQAVRIINDFEATALSLPHLVEKDVCSLGGGYAVAGAPMVVLGPGSGLGVAGLVGDGPRRIVVASEGGI